MKTGVEVVAPLLEPLRESIEATPTPTLTFLNTEFGTPFASVNSFGNWFRKRCKEAGVPGRAHGLRKAGATIAAEHGASDRELMALFGWETERQAGVYTRRADRAKLARGAAEALRAGTSIPAPLSSGAGKRAKS
jgi:integrase